MHYHLIPARHGLVLANVILDDWPEALESFSSMALGLYEGYFNPEQDIIKDAADAMDHGKGEGAYVGPPSLSLAILSCQDDEYCEWPSATWN